jgi:ribosomal protein S18 acetylase RimI-like enzyme
MEAHLEPDQRVGKPPDAAALASVLLEAFATYREWAPKGWKPHGTPGELEAQLIFERLGLPGYWCRIAETADEAVGYIVLRPATTYGDAPEPIPGLGHIWHLFVRPAWWGRGVATSLLEEAMNEARRREYTAARLWTPRENSRARAFYEREGWRTTDATHYSDSLDLELVEYRCSLEP